MFCSRRVADVAAHEILLAIGRHRRRFARVEADDQHVVFLADRRATCPAAIRPGRSAPACRASGSRSTRAPAPPAARRSTCRSVTGCAGFVAELQHRAAAARRASDRCRLPSASESARWPLCPAAAPTTAGSARPVPRRAHHRHRRSEPQRAARAFGIDDRTIVTSSLPLPPRWRRVSAPRTGSPRSRIRVLRAIDRKPHDAGALIHPAVGRQHLVLVRRGASARLTGSSTSRLRLRAVRRPDRRACPDTRGRPAPDARSRRPRAAPSARASRRLVLERLEQHPHQDLADERGDRQDHDRTRRCRCS